MGYDAVNSLHGDDRPDAPGECGCRVVGSYTSSPFGENDFHVRHYPPDLHARLHRMELELSIERGRGILHVQDKDKLKARLAAAERRAKNADHALSLEYAGRLVQQDRLGETLARLARIENAARAVLRMAADIDHIEIITVDANDALNALRDALEKK